MGRDPWPLRCPVGHASVRPTPEGESDYECQACEKDGAWGTDGDYDREEIREVGG